MLSWFSIVNTLWPFILFSNYPLGLACICPPPVPPAQSSAQGKTFMHKQTHPVQPYPQGFHSLHVNISLPDGRKRAPHLSKRKEVSVFVFSWCTSFHYLGLFHLHEECLNQYLQKLLSYNNHELQHSICSEKTNPLPPRQVKQVNCWVEIFRPTP